MAKSILINELIVEKGFAKDKKEAATLLMLGQVFVDGQPARPGQRIPRDADICAAVSDCPYVNKGGYKLKGALDAFQISPRGLVCLDAGASTGGFTDCLVQNGAALVYAVDVGFGQLHGSLRQNKRVLNMEKTNLGNECLLALSPPPVFCTCDLSYLSLVKAAPYYKKIMRGSGTLVALVKPLFETDDQQARRTGALHTDQLPQLLISLSDALNSQPDTVVEQVTFSPITGNKGTLEFFFLIRFGGTSPAKSLEREILSSVSAAAALNPYRK